MNNARVYVLCRIRSGERSGHVTNMNHRRNRLTNFKNLAVSSADLDDDYLRELFDKLVKQLMKTGVNSIEKAIHVLKKGDSCFFGMVEYWWLEPGVVPVTVGTSCNAG
jgi:hypothetical protein